MEIKKEIQEEVNAAEQLIKATKGFAIKNNEQYEKATIEVKGIKGKIKKLDEERKKMTKPIDESKKRIMDFFKKPIDFLMQSESSIKRAMIRFTDEQERIRKEAEDKLRREAEAKESRERERLEKIAREQGAKAEEEKQKRLEAEKKLKETKDAAEKKRLEDEAAKAKIAEDKAIAKQEKFEDKAEDVQIVVPTIQNQVQKQKGVSKRDNWKFRITDEKIIPREYLIPNDKLLTGFAKGTKGKIKVAGIEFYNEPIIAVRG